MSLRRWRALSLSLAFLSAALCAPFLFSSKVPMNRSDIFEHVGPFRHAEARELEAGRFPLWNPSLFCGMPFLGTSQAALLYPANQLFYFFPLVQAVNAFTAMHLFLNAFGMALLLFHLSRSRAAAWLGAAAWGFSHFFLGHVAAGHIIHLSGYAWAAFAALFLSSVGKRPAAAAGLAAAGALCFLSGHLQVSGQVAVLLALEAALTAAPSTGRTGKWKGCARALLLAAPLVAAQALPTASLLRRSIRGGHFFSPEAWRRLSSSYSLEPRALAAFVAPGLFGHPFDGTFRGGPASVFFESYGLYLGMIPLFLALAGLALSIRRRGLRPWATLFFLGIALGDRGPLFPFIWKLLAGQRAPARWMACVLWGLVLSIPAAFRRLPRWKGLRAGLLLATFLDLGFHARPFLRAEDPAPYWSPSAFMRSLPWKEGLPPRMAFGASTPMENKVMFYGFSSVGGYEALVPTDLDVFVSEVEPGAGAASTEVDLQDPSRKGFGVLDIRYALLDKPVAGWRTAARIGPGVLSENPAPGPAVRSLDGRARLTVFRRPSAERLDTRWDSDAAFTALWAERFEPGWEAYAVSAGTPGARRLRVRTDFGLFQAAETDGPAEEVFWRYRPPAARAGIPVGVLAWSALAAWGIARLKKLI